MDNHGTYHIDTDRSTLRDILKKSGINLPLSSNEEYLYFYYPKLSDPENKTTGLTFEPFDSGEAVFDTVSDPRSGAFVFGGDGKMRRVEKNINGTYGLSEPLDTILSSTTTKKPSWLDRLLAHFVDSYKQKVDRYELEKQFYDAAVFASAQKNVEKQLNDNYDALEAKGKGDFSRMDYIMIGGKSLRSLRTEEVIRKRGKNAFYNPKPQGPEVDEIKNTSKEHLAQIVFDAMAKGVQVEYLKMDPENMKPIIADAKNKKVLSVLNPIPEFKNIRAAHKEERIAEFERRNNISIKYNEYSSSKARHDAIDVCRQGICRNAVFDSSKHFGLTNSRLRENLFGDWMRAGKNREITHKTVTVEGANFSTQRSCLEAHVIAYLLVKNNMSLKDILNPDAGKTAEEKNKIRQQKADATDYMVNQFFSGNGKLEDIMDINVQASKKIFDYIEKNIHSVDFLDDRDMYSEKMALLTAAAYIAKDLFQERGREGSYEAAAKAYAKMNGLDPNSFDKMDFLPVHDKWNSAANISFLYENLRELNSISTGCGVFEGNGYDTLRDTAVANELNRHRAASCIAANKPFEETFSKKSMENIKMFLDEIIDSPDAVELRDELSGMRRSHEGEVMFAKLFNSGEIRKNWDATVINEDNKFEVIVKHTDPAAELPSSVKELEKSKAADIVPMIPGGH